MHGIRLVLDDPEGFRYDVLHWCSRYYPGKGERIDKARRELDLLPRKYRVSVLRRGRRESRYFSRVGALGVRLTPLACSGPAKSWNAVASRPGAPELRASKSDSKRATENNDGNQNQCDQEGGCLDIEGYNSWHIEPVAKSKTV